MKRISSILLVVCLAAVALAREFRHIPAGVLKWVQFDRGSAADESYLAQSPTVSSGATFVTRAADFDGTTNASITYPDLTAFESAPFTVTAWVRIDAASTTRRNIVGKAQNSAPYPGWFLHWSNSLGWVFATVENSSSAYRAVTISGTTGHNDGSWRHVAWSCDNINSTTNWKFWINGVSQTLSTSTAGTVTSLAGTGVFTLGGLCFSVGHTDRLNGALDDVRYYPTALTEADVWQIFSSTRNETRP